ncbi:hypothetical protein LYZ37_16315 [Vibrio tubiashii]|uniref:hypothetical protein n=1 Tax=Vibrio tubiashii TaxID=29498 RepID=UPI00234E662D|nr:hypothetical protein [Vibrio tubiashii]WCP69583.1 hypothetical protein LYZ37_16315 [Vibrio tubiashii]
MRTTLIMSVISTLLFISQHVLAISPATEEPILWVSGNISETNSLDGVELDEAMIFGLEQGTIHTNNHVVEEVVEYRGPTLISLLDYVGARGDTIKVIAWDEYLVTIPVADIKKYGVILATHESGNRMTLDDKGPFFVVFPFTDHAELRNDAYYSLSVWQVREIVVE